MISLEKLDYLPYFTIQAANQIAGTSLQATRQLLSRQERTGKIIRLKRGYYMSREYWLMHKNDLDFMAMTAAILQPQSYLSGAWVLQKYGVMTEGIYSVTAVTTKHTRVITNKIATFYFSNIADKLFNGYKEIMYGGVICREAKAAKALFDYFYLRHEPSGIKEKNFDLAENERLNINDWNQSRINELLRYIKMSKSPKMNRIANNLKNNVWV